MAHSCEATGLTVAVPVRGEIDRRPVLRPDVATIGMRIDDVADMYLIDLHSAEMTPAATRPDVTEELAHLSPDGRWLALTTDSSGRYEIALQAIDGDTRQRVQVTTEGGEEPLWAPDMSEIYYRYGRTLYSVSISIDKGRLIPGRPAPLFEDESWENINGYSYWPNPTDGRFLILRADQPPTARSLRVVEGWKNIRADE